MSQKYDLAIVYRIHPGISKTPFIFADDKFRLAELCLFSFKLALGNLKYKLWVLLDNCPETYLEMFKKHFSDKNTEYLKLDGEGNAGTFSRQLDILSNQKMSSLVYFAEDDYFYLPGQLEKLVNLLEGNKKIDFVSPYDHLDYYQLNLHQHKTNIIIENDHHWRRSHSTCMTFMTRTSVLQQALPTFQSYLKNNYDVSIWMSLTKIRVFNPVFPIKYLFTNKMLLTAYIKAWLFCWQQIIFGKTFSLYSPIPSLATHMESTGIAPGIDWEFFINKTLDQLDGAIK